MVCKRSRGVKLAVLHLQTPDHSQEANAAEFERVVSKRRAMEGHDHALCDRAMPPGPHNLQEPIRDMRPPSSRQPHWAFPDVVDLEYLMAMDATTHPDDIWKRDRAIYRDHLVKRFPNPALASRSGMVRAWLRQCRNQLKDGYFPGRDLSASWRMLVTIAATASFVYGMLHAGAVLLVLDRQGHVNIIKAFALTVFLQLFVSLLVVLAFFLRKSLVRRFGELPSLRVAFASWVLTVFNASSTRRLAGAVQLLLPARRKYARLVASHVGMAASACVVAMNIGLVASLTIFHFAADDVRFGWTTTYDIGPVGVSTIVGAVAAPWADLVPAARPTTQQIEQSWLLRERAGTSVSPDASRAWAFFLVAAILFYGCVLRIALFLIAAHMARHSLKRLDFNGRGVQELIERMSKPRPEERGDAPSPPLPPPVGWWKRMWRRFRRG